MSAGSSAPTEVDRSLELFRQLPGDTVARDRLIEMHAPLARYLARRFEGRRESLEDLTQVAMLGLVKAIDRFDVSREIQFTTYASATIVGELKRHFRDKGWSVRVPRRLQEAGLLVAGAIGSLNQELGRSPTIAEIADRTSLTEEEVLEATEAANAYSAQSLDVPIDEHGTTAAARLESNDDALDTMLGWASVAPAIRRLPERERRILFLRFFHDRTQSEIAQELGVSQMHVSRLLTKTLQQLRGSLGATGPRSEG
jgi:RNA polymerase sigma-B factor